MARNSSEVISGITAKVAGAVNVLYNVLTLLSSALMVAAVAVAIMFIDPAVAVLATCGFGICYGLVALATRGRLRRNSEDIGREQTHVIKALQEGLGGIRDVLLDGSQPLYCDVYRRADLALRKAQGNNLFVGGSPRYAMEAMGMILIGALAYWMSQRPGGIGVALPVLGALALGAQRLIPALQQGYSAWASIAGNQSALAETIDLLDQPMPPHVQDDSPAMQIGREICLEDVRFRYQPEAPWVLNGISLRIPKGSRVGFIGSTGSGKSTTLDIVMGLLKPVQGRLLVDGRPVEAGSMRAWQRTLAHVPQSIYLADASVAENIAFGVPSADIDLARVKDAARRAQIADYIEAQPHAYDAMVGERGVRLSGGQRQRIGIARALYKHACVLILDEATSALDNATERSVMDAIQNLDRELTILIIAHRISTLQHCDVIVRLGDGVILEQGTYAEFCERDASFRELMSVRD
ncbi:MAG: ABC transporter ATP-binding protein [Aquabacterium sp.]